MNRCITCGKIVTRPKAQKIIGRGGHKYLVCCPLCEKEFNRDPEHYIAVAQAIFGDYSVKAHSQSAASPPHMENVSHDIADTIHLTRNMKEFFDTIRHSFSELVNHFDQISASGGLEGLRKSMRDHRQMMYTLQENMTVYAGVCRFVLSVTETPQITIQGNMGCTRVFKI